jgi:hypothetical protein
VRLNIKCTQTHPHIILFADASIVVEGVLTGHCEEDGGSDSDDDQVVGPMPATAGADKEYVARLLTHEIKKAIAV